MNALPFLAARVALAAFLAAALVALALYASASWLAEQLRVR